MGLLESQDTGKPTDHDNELDLESKKNSDELLVSLKMLTFFREEDGFVNKEKLNMKPNVFMVLQRRTLLNWIFRCIRKTPV